jgi:glutamine synthetase type III
MIPPWRVRKTADILEGMIADDLAPLATYQEMLFTHQGSRITQK